MTDIFKNIITEEISDADRIMNADGTINFHSFSTKETLNPDIFNEDGYLKEGFISSLLDIYHKIIKGINFLRESDISDVVLVGSLVSFHYSSYSDIDMHILVDMSKVDKDIEELREELRSVANAIAELEKLMRNFSKKEIMDIMKRTRNFRADEVEK